MSFTIRAITRRALIVASAGVLALSTLPAAAADSLDELIDLNLRAWAGEPELLSEVYAPDGVHTATFYDMDTEYTGPDEIARVTGSGKITLIGPRIELPAPDGEWRWVSFVTLGGGTVCLWRAVDGQVTRHDCLVPKDWAGSGSTGVVVEGELSAEVTEIRERLGWGADTTLADLQAVYAPDAVHSARFLNKTNTYQGPEEISRVARMSVAMDLIEPVVEFEAPEGELAWAQANTLGGGSVCLFHAVDGMITRHDCVVHTSM